MSASAEGKGGTRQVWIPRIGGPEVLEVRDAPDPEPRAGEVRIRVAASGVNFADCLARMGLYPDAPKLPAVVGYEVAGEVDRVGPGADGVPEGARVVALTRFGGYASAVTVPVGQVLPIPASLSLEQAAEKKAVNALGLHVGSDARIEVAGRAFDGECDGSRLLGWSS